MPQQWTSLFAYATLALTITPVLPAQSPVGPPPFRFVTVVPGVYATVEPRANALSPFVHGNSMFVVNDSDVFAFDANRTPSAARATIAQLRAVTSKPVRYLMISHFHGDHLLGTQAFAEAWPGLRVITTDSTRLDMLATFGPKARKRDAAYYAATNNRYDSMATAGVDLAGRPLTPARKAQWAMTRHAFRDYYSVEAPGIRIVMPDTTFSDALTMHSGRRELQLLSFGRGDTRGDGILWLPRQRVVATGDLLVEPVPYSGAQWPSEWLRALRRVRALNPLHIVPGHGEVQHDTRYLDLVIAVTDSAIREVKRSIAAGQTLEQTKRQVTMAEFRQRFTHGEPLVDDRWLDFIDGLIDGAYAEGTAKPAT
ncbi:MAG: MBL fold metallo-hydrolase [Gemmatimonadota bacterium]